VTYGRDTLGSRRLLLDPQTVQVIRQVMYEPEVQAEPQSNPLPEEEPLKQVMEEHHDDLPLAPPPPIEDPSPETESPSTEVPDDSQVEQVPER
jgi:hypothetical protein